MQNTAKYDALVERQTDPVVKQILKAAGKWRHIYRHEKKVEHNAVEILIHAVDAVEWND